VAGVRIGRSIYQSLWSRILRVNLSRWRAERYSPSLNEKPHRVHPADGLIPLLEVADSPQSEMLVARVFQSGAACVQEEMVEKAWSRGKLSFGLHVGLRRCPSTSSTH
jgi:hypothetical protein